MKGSINPFSRTFFPIQLTGLAYSARKYTQLPETTIRTVEVPLKIREEAAAAREEATRRQEEPIIAPQEKGKKIAEAAPQQKKKDEGVKALKYEPLASPNNSFLE